MSLPTRPKMELIKWLDHHEMTGWLKAGDAEPLETNIECEAIGFVVNESPERLVLAGNRSDELHGNLMVIVKSAITKRKPLRLAA